MGLMNNYRILFVFQQNTGIFVLLLYAGSWQSSIKSLLTINMSRGSYTCIFQWQIPWKFPHKPGEKILVLASIIQTAFHESYTSYQEPKSSKVPTGNLLILCTFCIQSNKGFVIPNAQETYFHSITKHNMTNFTGVRPGTEALQLLVSAMRNA